MRQTERSPTHPSGLLSQLAPAFCSAFAKLVVAAALLTNQRSREVKGRRLQRRHSSSSRVRLQCAKLRLAWCTSSAVLTGSDQCTGEMASREQKIFAT
jgi:hypothetical protein